MMPAEQVRDWLYQEMPGAEGMHALQAISRERGQEVIEEIQRMYPDAALY